MSPFTAYGVPADGWASSYKGERPSLTRSGTLVPDLGPKQLAWLKSKGEVFADANRRVIASGDRVMGTARFLRTGIIIAGASKLDLVVPTT